MNVSTILCRSIIGTVTLFVLASVSAAFSQSKILGEAKEKQPSYGELENFTILSYTDLDGWDQAAEFRVSKMANTLTYRTIKASASSMSAIPPDLK